MPQLSRRSFCLVAPLAAVAAAGLSACSSASSQSGEKTSGSGESTSTSSSGATSTSSSSVIDSVSADDPYATGTHHVTIEVADYGTIELALNANVAPITVSNFCDLASDGFYDGLTFHRIISGFMIQGGDPNGDGTGGSTRNIKGEFSKNGVENPISHVRGTISMARSSAYDSGSSQFFIMHKTTTSLDGQYAAFGNVTSGIEVVDAICEKVQVEDSNGTVAAQNQPVITKVNVVD